MHTTIKYTKFNAGDLSFSTPEENKVIPNLVKYRQISLVSHSKYLINGLEIVPRIQGPWMNLDTYGFPGEIDKYRNPLSELELRKLKVPLSLNTLTYCPTLKSSYSTFFLVLFSPMLF
jgi:hypothetical protein